MRGIDPDAVRAALDDWRNAPLPERIRAVLGLLEAVTVRPESVSAADVRPLLDLGIEPDAIREALYVAFLFNLLNRCADTFGFGTPTEAEARRIGFLADKLGYGLVQIPG